MQDAEYKGATSGVKLVEMILQDRSLPESKKIYFCRATASWESMAYGEVLSCYTTK